MRNEQVNYKKIVDKYTDYIVDEFISFIDKPFFEGQTFFNFFSNDFSNKDKLRNLNIKEDAFLRLIDALISVDAIVIRGDKLERGNRPSIIQTSIAEAYNSVLSNGSFDEQYDKFHLFLEHQEIQSQLESVGLYRDYLIDSIRYDILVIKRYLSPEMTMEGLRVGAAIADKVFDLSSPQIFDSYKERPKLLQVYGRGFTSSHFLSDLNFIKTIDFKNNDVLVDVGGCYGNLGKIILEKSDKSIIYNCLDLDGVKFSFGDEILKNENNFKDRFHFISGNFFERGNEIKGLEGRRFDKIFLGWILHDWNDEQCLDILTRCVAHMNNDSEIYIFEILPNDRKMSFNFTDWLMMVMADGYERNISQYEVIFNKVGLSLYQTEGSGTGRSLMKLRVANG